MYLPLLTQADKRKVTVTCRQHPIFIVFFEATSDRDKC